MTKKEKRPWTVLPHDEIQKIDDNLWAVESFVPGAGFKRRMCIIKRGDGKLLFFHAIPLKDEAMEEIKAWGVPAYLVVGHHQHMIDAEAFREKLSLKLYGPKACIDKIKERDEAAETLEDIPADDSIEIKSVPGVSHGETIIAVRHKNGKFSLLFSDVIQNGEPTLPFIFRLLGFAGGPKVVPVFKLLFAKDKAAIKKFILDYANRPGLVRLVPMHGLIVENGAADALKTAIQKF